MIGLNLILHKVQTEGNSHLVFLEIVLTGRRHSDPSSSLHPQQLRLLLPKKEKEKKKTLYFTEIIANLKLGWNSVPYL